MIKQRILHCVDMQEGFMNPLREELYVPNSDSIIEDINMFFLRIGQTNKPVDHAIFTLDTHFWFEYNKSPEAEIFPDIHCEYGTQAWALSVRPDYLGPVPLWFVNKNEFDFWGQNKLTDQIRISDLALHQYPLSDVEPVFKELGLDHGGIKPIAEITSKTSAKELKKYLGDDGELFVVPIHQDSKMQGSFVYEQKGKRKALAFVHAPIVQAYKELFYLQHRTDDFEEIVFRDDFFQNIGSETEIVMAGVASDFCVKHALIGYLEKGCQVVVMSDLVRGVATPIEEVVRSPELLSYFENGQLVLQSSEDYLGISKEKIRPYTLPSRSNPRIKL